jgi:hypothetical protein
VLILTRKTRRLAFVDHPKGESFPLGPSGGTPVRVAVNEQGGSILLKEGSQMHSRGCLRLATLEACDCHNHDHLTWNFAFSKI